MSEPGHNAGLVESVLAHQFPHAEVVPPRRLLLATMPVEQVGEHPPRVLGMGGGARVAVDAREQARAQRLDRRIDLARVVVRSAVRRLGARQGVASRRAPSRARAPRASRGVPRSNGSRPRCTSRPPGAAPA